MFQGNRDLSDVTHVVVDEVHERTILVCIRFFYLFSCYKTSNMFLCWMRYLNYLYFSFQSDFLLIVLKNLVEKRSNQQGRKLKVILM
jgi:ATP-dependent RNA helicase DHX29